MASALVALLLLVVWSAAGDDEFWPVWVWHELGSRMAGERWRGNWILWPALALGSALAAHALRREHAMLARR